MKTNRFALLLFFIISFLEVSIASAQKTNYATTISAAADKIESKVIDWRHDIHEHPELGNREIRTAALIAKHFLKK